MWSEPPRVRLYSTQVSMDASLRAQARRATPPMTSQGIARRMISSTRALPSSTRPNPPLIALPMPDAAAVVQRDQAHAARGVAGEALDRHVRHDVAAVLDVGRLAEGRIRAAGIVVVAAEHDRADLAARTISLKLQRDLHPALRVLIENSRLGADHEPVLLRIPDPDVIVPVLEAAVAGSMQAMAARSVLRQILVLAAQADPAKGPVAVVEQERAHDVLDVGRKDEPVLAGPRRCWQTSVTPAS